MTLADWIMRAATANPPRGREHWAHGMHAEYDELNIGKLNWAFGCWTTMFGWRLHADTLYLVVMVSVTYLWMLGVFDEPVVNRTFLQPTSRSRPPAPTPSSNAASTKAPAHASAFRLPISLAAPPPATAAV